METQTDCQVPENPQCSQKGGTNMGKKAARQEISEVRIGVSAENIDENGVDQVQWNKTKK